MERPDYRPAPITLRLGPPKIDTSKKVKVEKKAWSSAAFGSVSDD